MNWVNFTDINADAMPEAVPRRISEPETGRFLLVGGWRYFDVAGDVVSLKARYEGQNGKTLRPFYFFRGEWQPTKPEGFQLPLYGLTTLSLPDPVFVCEGEKAAAALHRVGLPAVGLAGGSHADTADFSPLDGRDIILWPDHDEAGARAMESVSRRLHGRCRRVVPGSLGLKTKGDAADVVAQIIATSGEIEGWDGSTELYPPEFKKAVVDELRLRLNTAVNDVSREFSLPWQHLPGDWMTAEIPPRQFVFCEAVPVGCITLMLAVGGFGKSMLTLILAASVAMGRALIPDFTPTGEGAVVLLSLEEDLPEITRRLRRIARAYGLSNDDGSKLVERIKIVSVSRFELLGSGNTFQAGGDLQRLKADLAAIRPRLVILDPLAALIGGAVDENDNASAQAVVALLRDAIPADAGAVVATHVAKMDRDSSTSARGASAWMDAARMVLALRPLKQSEAKSVQGDEPHGFAALEVRKSNYAPLPAPVYLRRETASGMGGVWRAIDFEAMKRHSEAERLRVLREVIPKALASFPDGVTRQEAIGKCKKNEAGAARGSAFREKWGQFAGGENVSCKVASDVIGKLLDQGDLVQVTASSGRREILRPSEEVTPEHSGLNPECSGLVTTIPTNPECPE